MGKKPKDVDWYIKLEDWNEEISARVDAVVLQVFQNYRYYSLEIGKKGSFFRNYRIGPLDLSIACPPSDMPDSWATINAFQILFDPDGVSAYLRKSDFAPSSKSNEDIWEMNANNQSLLNYERMDAIPDLYLLFSFARYRGIEFTNVTPNIEDLCCGSFYQLYEKRPLTLHKKLKGFIRETF